MKIQAASLSDTGPARENNEDVVLCEPEHGLFAVIDGMGGAAAGEVAAGIALRQIRGRLLRPDDGRESAEERVREALTLASNAIHQEAQANAAYRGMGCVATLALLDAEGRLTVGHVGDTRLYRIRGRSIEKLTSDHSPVGELEDAGEITEEEAMRHPRRNQVFRDLGSEPHQAHDDHFIQILDERLADNEAILLCSDGLTDVVKQEEILALIKKHQRDPQQVVRALVDRANANSKDNVSVVYAQGPRFIGSRSKAASSQRAPKTQDRHEASNPAAAMAPAPVVRGAPLPLLAGLVLAACAGGYWLGTRSVAAEPMVAANGTIAEALAAARPGDEVRLAPGVYRERVILRDRISLVARGSEPVEIQAPPGLDGPLVQATGVHARLAGIRIDATGARQALLVRDGDLTLDNLDVTGGSEAAIEFSGKAHVVLQASRVRATAHGIVLRDTAEVRIERTLFAPVRKNQAQPALLIESIRPPELVGNWFFDFAQPIWSTLELENRALDGNAFQPESKSPVRLIKRGAP